MERKDKIMNQAMYQNILKNVDFEYIKNIIDRNKGKKVYCFGAGSAAKLLMDKIPNLQVNKFLDNNEELHGEEIWGVEVVNPEILKKEDKNNYIVLIISQHIVGIEKQLEDFGLKKDIEYYDIYTPMRPYFTSVKIDKKTKQFEEFIDRIPNDLFKDIPLSKEEHVGVVCICEASKTLVYYALVKGLLLRMDGYKVTLIIDALSGFESYIFFSGVEKFLLENITPVLEKIKEKCPDIEIHYIDQEGKEDLEQRDKEEICYYTPYIKKWLRGRPEQGLSNIKENVDDVITNILYNAFSYVKAYFRHHSYTSIDVRSGVHRHRMAYTCIARRNGMRVSTSDSETLYSSDGAAAHYGDVVKLVKGDYFSEDEKNAIIELANDDFQKRKNSLRTDEGYNYQTEGYAEHIQSYDIIIPLNIFWDAAALARDDVFANEFEWLNETLSFLMEHTNATVMVREHPAQACNGEYEFNYDDIKQQISCLEQYKHRIYYASAGDAINTYQYLEQCKLVLPYTSTVGIEAAMLGKNVITHTKVYYSNCNMTYRANGKKDYYDAILYYLDTLKMEPEKIRNASLVYYFLQETIGFECLFSPKNDQWLQSSIDELYQQITVRDIINLVGKGIPIAYAEIERKLYSREESLTRGGGISRI